MNKHLGAGLLVLGLLAAGSPAYAWSVECGASPHVGANAGGGGGGTSAGPWYLYFPYEAHFQLPAPVGFPFWPGPVTAAGAAEYFPAARPAPLQLPEARPLSPVPPGYSPVGYYYYGPAPSYWYGR
jgi:hypothetical protein